MKRAERILAAREKLHRYGQDILSLRGSGIAYAQTFGLLLVLLPPVLVLETAILPVFGVDTGIMQTLEPIRGGDLDEREVPGRLRDLVPLAMKRGVGDFEEGETLIGRAPLSELVAFERTTGPRMDEVADWLDSYCERESRNSCT